MAQQDNLFICPVCHEGLTIVAKELKCVNNHSFNIAREGYVNLLLKQRPGDTKEMLLARRQFLAGGYYAPLSDAINKVAASILVGKASPLHRREARILDAGCGEGYYLGRMTQFITDQPDLPPCAWLGIDTSKDAMQMASKKYKDICFAVADIKGKLLVPDQSIHLLLNMFAPKDPSEFSRVMADEGHLLIVIPGPNHLSDLRTVTKLLDIQADKQQWIIKQLSECFRLVDAIQIHYGITLDNTQLVNVVSMTPNYWHLSQAERVALSQIEQVQTVVDFEILLFQKQAY